MADPLAEILGESDDFRLCDRLFGRIAERRANRFDVTGVPEEEATVALVWHTYGIVGNGGFHYLLEGDFDGDPGFARTALAFREIGCARAAGALEQVLRCFPGGRPHEDVDRRLRHYKKRFGGVLTGPDCQFFDAEEEIQKRLAAYIRARAGSFSHLQ
jgi:hypothetical protein